MSGPLNQEPYKRKLVAIFANNKDSLTVQEFGYLADCGITCYSGVGHSAMLTELGRSYLPAGPDSDHSQCPDEDYGTTNFAEKQVQQDALNAQLRASLDRFDMVNEPPHYTQGGIECIDAIRAALTPEEFRGFCKGNALKYVWREKHKGGDEDMKKAGWYLNKVAS